jgi:hypothetical protein
MIDLAIQHVTSQLNQYLKRAFDLSEDIVVASAILEQDGSAVPQISNKIVSFVINIEKDDSCGSGMGQGWGDRSILSSRPVSLNIYLVFAANFSGGNYMEALKFLSCTIGFFQRRPVFDHQNSPEMDRKIEKLVLDIENINLKDLSSLWGAISGKYLPSIIYKMRMVTFDSGDIIVQTPLIKKPQSSLLN